ncbi:cardiolipin synthase B [Bordetella genomosp. 1]|uniref:Cardiolipin synthase B n=1 Tax=Bordetella genomosp. 1 TaxID=1395607 RepID=A0A261SGV9_9BORD|nr:cardiolipin synthase ClsB [Bordetella genomosp. 1]OZI36659.1 cardiolipin synthase B [Bordetella genomosp. 1]OZI64246.1 cardiolipin synthase B [Bordetella genomosp. 1]
MNLPWRANNEFKLLINGGDYFPAVNEAIARAEREVLVETFILFDDEVGRELRQTLIDAAQRGVSVDLTVDGYGSDELSEEFISGMTQAGVRLHVFDPRPRLLGMRTNLFRRMHRKIVAVDETLAFIGGINFGADHLIESGPEAKQDYAVRIRGPLATDVANYARAALGPRQRRRWRRRPAAEAAPGADGVGRLVVRDNDAHRTDIERYYRAGIRSAREDILIANAYFFPGYNLLRDLTKAARRGVRVRLVLQGQPDMPVAKYAASMLYDYLARAGVQIYEYCERPLHGKVACVDGAWSTVGSSNLDPLSLALNLEANVVVHDAGLNRALRESLEALISEHCKLAPKPPQAARKLRRLWFGVVIYHFLRRFPAWAGNLPAHKPRLKTLGRSQTSQHADAQPGADTLTDAAPRTGPETS